VIGAEVVLAGLTTGLHAASWGGFKDSPFEGFRWRSFLRSPALALVVALALMTVGPVGSVRTPLVLVGLLYAGERLSTEWWKAFVREDDQTAYAIPMRVAVLGRPVDARLPRYLAGVVVAGLLLLVLVVPVPGPDLPAWALALVGGTGGWLTAVGGAWKDAPVEGFSGWKFLRSPVVATAWALVLLPFVADARILAVAAGGLAVLVVETYKTFLTGGRPPGKFAGRPVRFRAGTARERCRAVHCLVYAALAAVVLGSPTAAVAVAGILVVAMLVTGHRGPDVPAAQEPDADVVLRRERS
jgi:hypothetical protein